MEPKIDFVKYLRGLANDLELDRIEIVLPVVKNEWIQTQNGLRLGPRSKVSFYLFHKATLPAQDGEITDW